MYYLGFDIGGTKCAVILGRSADGAPEICGRHSFATASAACPEEALERMCACGDALLKEHGLKNECLSAVGISCGGPLDSRKGLICSPPNLPGWDRIPAADIVRSHFGVPVLLQNDANAGALAEWKFGAGRGCRNMVFITFGTGCGAGLILDGRLYSGTNDNAGECGHIRLTDFGPVGYGKSGSVEGYCSGGGIGQLGRTYLYEMVQQGASSELCDLYKSGTEIDARLLAEYARKGDAAAKHVFEVSGEMLGRTLSLMTDLLNPEAFIIGGVFARCTDLLLDRCTEVMRREALAPSAGVCRVLPAGLGEQIGDYASLAVAAYLSDSLNNITED